MELVAQLFVLGLSSGAIYALLAGGLVIVFKVTGIVNFMHGQWVVIGALMYCTLIDRIGAPASLVASVLLTAVIAALLCRLIIRWLAEAPFTHQCLVTIALAFFTEGLALVIWGKEPRSAAPFSEGDAIAVFGTLIAPQTLWIFAIMILAVVAIWLFLTYTTVGKAMQACAANRVAARVVGIKPDYMAVIAFALSGLYGAIAGISYLPLQAISYNSGMMYTLKAFVAAIIGGMTSFGGAVLGGFVLGIAESLGAGLISSGYKDTIGFIAMTAIILYRVLRTSGMPSTAR